jgi:tRNA pseudouridine38-40 synthase
MAHYQVILAYDGSQFKGYQRQARARTVQGEVEEALRRLGWQGRAILSAGRTDTGVHAAGQVIAFDMDWAHSPQELLQAMNANLPSDVAAREVRVAAQGFHPRYSAISRSYRYHILCAEIRDPLRERYAWRVWPPVDDLLLQAAARVLPGTHDFTAFGTPLRPGGSTVRDVIQATWRRDEGLRTFEISANAFLYHMVRRLVFTQVLVGQGRISLEEFAAGITAARPQTPGLAPPQGLVLAAVDYRQDRQEDNRLESAEELHQTLAVSGEDNRGQDLRP